MINPFDKGSTILATDWLQPASYNHMETILRYCFVYKKSTGLKKYLILIKKLEDL